MLCSNNKVIVALKAVFGQLALISIGLLQKRQQKFVKTAVEQVAYYFLTPECGCFTKTCVRHAVQPQRHKQLAGSPAHAGLAYSLFCEVLNRQPGKQEGNTVTWAELL